MLRLISFLAFLLLADIALANSPQTDFTGACGEIQALEAAVQKSLPSTLVNSGSYVEKANTQCRLNLARLLRPRLLKLMTHQFRYDGANCWASALYLKGLRDVFTYGSDQEFRWALERSGHCRKIGAGEAPEAGDIGAIRIAENGNPLGAEHHGFVYVNERYAFSKFDVTPESHLRLVEQSQFLRAYGVADQPEECSKVQSASVPVQCKYWLTYYRCEDARPSYDHLEIEDARNLIRELGASLARDYWRGTDLSAAPELEQKYIERIGAIYTYQQRITSKDQLDLLRAWGDSLSWTFTGLQYKQSTPSTESQWEHGSGR